MNVFLISPVRVATPETTKLVANIVAKLEKHHQVYWPLRDTDQNDDVGNRICQDNKSAISSADWVCIFYEPNSTGSLFDIGMAFAMWKPIRCFNLPPVTEGKSFANLINYLHGYYDHIWKREMEKTWAAEQE